MQDKKFSVILPSYNPDEKLVRFIEALEAAGIDDIIVVNDGSKKETLGFFPKAEEHPCVTLLTHKKNRGKGAALKTAFEYVLHNRTAVAGVVTADGDGQHLCEDVVRCALDMMKGDGHITLGVRDFSLPDVPKRSRRGNRITSLVFRLFVGMKLSDTQTGLRAIPFSLLPLMLEVEGDRYEYETNMLLKMKEKKLAYTEVEIATVYLEENRTSHFRPVRDSIRIYSLIFGKFLKYLLSSCVCLLLEQIIQVLLFSHVTLNITIASSLFLNTFFKELFNFLPARATSSVFNFFLNKTLVFEDKKQTKGAMKRYYILWAVQAIVTALITTAFCVTLEIHSAFVYAAATLLIKVFIFFFSYKIQKIWVFAPKKDR